mmetsp:Transcript_51778/g.160648  ORF Transcript_51778/g.160648 Transcript_51778/m.160648 type:complete len:473 (-) Transcript_51778:344-1762(-)
MTLNMDLMIRSSKCCRTHSAHEISQRSSAEKPHDESPLCATRPSTSSLMARHRPWFCTLHFAKDRNTRTMSTGRSSVERDERNEAAALKRSVCTRRISERMASMAVSCTGAKLLCRARAARPTDAKKRCSEKPTETKAARHILISCGANSMSRDDISEEAALNSALESSAKRPPGRLFFQDANVLVREVNCVLLNSRSLGTSIRLSSVRKSSLCSAPAAPLSNFWTTSTACCGVKALKRMRNSRRMCSTSSGACAACMRDMSASNSKSARVRVSSCKPKVNVPSGGPRPAGRVGTPSIVATACLVCCTLPCRRSSIFCTESSSFCGFGGSVGRRKPFRVRLGNLPMEPCTMPDGAGGDWSTSGEGGAALPAPELGDPNSACTSMEALCARSAALSPVIGLCTSSKASVGGAASAKDEAAGCVITAAGGGGSISPRAAFSANRWSASLSNAWPSPKPKLLPSSPSAACCCCIE